MSSTRPKPVMKPSFLNPIRYSNNMGHNSGVFISLRFLQAQILTRIAHEAVRLLQCTWTATCEAVTAFPPTPGCY
jgi:hypothetical protein